MSQDRLNGLAILSIERAMLEKIDYATVMDDFAGKNSRRIIFTSRILFKLLFSFWLRLMCHLFYLLVYILAWF